jgi:hypothetical protein
LRRPPGAAQAVSFDKIMDALCRLDRTSEPSPASNGRRRTVDHLDWLPRSPRNSACRWKATA